MEYSEIIYNINKLAQSEIVEFKVLSSGAKIKKISSTAKRVLRDGEEATELKKLLENDKKYKGQYEIKIYHELLNTARLECYISTLDREERRLFVSHLFSMLEEGLASSDVTSRIDTNLYIILICNKFKDEDVASDLVAIKNKASELIKGISVV